MTIQTTTLPNGLRVITDTVETVESVAIGIWCDVGTRHENMAHNGVAHMVEHMMFNGTPSRTSQQIVQSIEAVGGQMNAYTSRELTAYYVHLLKEDMALALDVLSDMIQHSTFPDSELEKERGVIIQEIGMANDTPDDLIFDLYQEKAYPGQSLGAPILGTAEIVQGMSKDTLFDYVNRFYTPKNLVISASGNVTHEETLEKVQQYFTDLPTDHDGTYAKADYQGGDNRLEKDLEQTHIVLGFQGIGRAEPKYYASVLLATIMGGGMSSRLFQEVREKRGLVYSVYSSHSAYADDGQFEIYAGTGPDKVNELMPVLCDEVHKLRQTIVTQEELLRAQNQLRSSILMGRESMLSRANRQAKHMINYNEVVDIQKIIHDIQSITVADIQTAAQTIFTTKPTLAALGTIDGLESYDVFQNRLAA
jgi:predicted Zn-dependent peptidase